jgi:xanthine/uracil permease
MEAFMQKRTKLRIRIAALLIVIGMVLEIISFTWVGPSAFMLFIGGGVLCSIAGIALYLFMLFVGSRKLAEHKQEG